MPEYVSFILALIAVATPLFWLGMKYPDFYVRTANKFYFLATAASACMACWNFGADAMRRATIKALPQIDAAALSRVNDAVDVAPFQIFMWAAVPPLIVLAVEHLTFLLLREQQKKRD